MRFASAPSSRLDGKVAIVVGSGPNGLTAAIVLARAGARVTVLEAAERAGGGMRTSERTVPGLRHDECSAFHPMGAGSPVFNELGLDRHGLTWLWPELQLAHPLDGGTAAVLHRDVSRTAAGLGRDADRWRQVFGGLARHYDDLASEIMRPVLHRPRHPMRLARFGVPAVAPATVLARLWQTPGARALFGGVAAHAMRPLDAPGTAAIGLALTAAGHRWGWPVAQGGSEAIASALVAELQVHGGEVVTGVRVAEPTDLPPADVVMLDLSPTAALRVVGARLPPAVARGLRRYRYGPAAFKLDLAVERGVPWTAPACARAGVVHLGGTIEEINVNEREINRGRMPVRPFVLVGQQYLADPSRSRGDLHPVWAYAHVPHGYDGDASEAVVAQIERFAPGVRDRIVAQTARTPAELAAYNENYVGGDIGVGATTLRQTVMRPRVTLRPYDLGVPGMFLCSAATPPGPGVHGMCGYYAARAAIRRLAG